jgi:hypothetical protein
MDTSLTAESLAELTAINPPTCLSLYQPTHRHRPDNQQDPIRYRNLVKALEASLRHQYSAQEISTLLAPFEALARDQEFWSHTLDGSAVLGAPEFFRVFRLQRRVPELALVASSFHTKPLRRFLQSADCYQVLGLSRSGFRLFEGNRDTLDEVQLAEGIPQTLEAALGDELTEPRQTVASYGGTSGGTGVAMHHGHGGRKDQLDLDAERFFRVVDRAILRHYSRVSELPLILAALPEHHHLFRKISHNPFLLEVGLPANPDGLSMEELRQRVWEVVEPQYQARQLALAEEFSEAKAHGLGSDELVQVAQAAACGRVATLLIESGRQIAGRLDSASGQVQRADLSDPDVDDLLDDLGKLVVSKGGEVRVIPGDRMPGNTGLAAIYRH